MFQQSWLLVVRDRSMNPFTGVSVKYLMVGETNSMVGYHLMTKGHSIQLGSGGVLCGPPAALRQHPHNNNNININNNISRVSYDITIKSQSPVPYKVVSY